MRKARKIKYLVVCFVVCSTLGILFFIINSSFKKREYIAVSESAQISILSCTGLLLEENRAEFSVSVDGADEYESEIFTGTVELGGEKKDVWILFSSDIAVFGLEYALSESYFLVEQSTVFVSQDGETQFSFDQTYLMNVETQTVIPVGVLYNPTLLSWEETTLTASCGGATVDLAEPALGLLCVGEERVSAALTVDLRASTFSLLAQELPVSFTIEKTALFVSAFGAYRFDVEYLFDRERAVITPTQITVSFYDGNSLVAQYPTRIGETITLPDSSILAGTGMRLGLSDGQKLYPFGAKILAESTVNFYAQYFSLTTQEEACARLIAPYGVRFTTSFSTQAYQNALSLDGVSLSFGAEISVYGSTKKLQIPTDPVSLFEKEENTCYHTAIVGIKTANFALVYQCTPTLSIAYSNGETVALQGSGTEEGRSYVQVLKSAYDELASYDEETQSVIISEYEKVLSSKAIKPVLLVYVNGENSTILQEQIAELILSFSLKLGDEIDLTSFFLENAPDGFTIDGKESVLSGKLGERGLVIEVYYVG